MLKRKLQSVQVAATWIVCGSLAFVVGCGQSSREPAPFPGQEPPEQTQSSEPKETAVDPADPVAKSTPAQEKPHVDDSVRRAVHFESYANDSSANSGVETAAATPSARPKAVPPVLLTKQHAALCRVKVGDTMPALELPNADGEKTTLADLYGESATVVVFWKGDRRMSQIELADLGPDVEAKLGSRGVNVVVIAVETSASDAQAAVKDAGASFPVLLDADGKAFEKVGALRLPWTLVLDRSGNVVWFDIEYSLATRRELQQTLLATLR